MLTLAEGALTDTVDKADRRVAPTTLPAIIADWSATSEPEGTAFSSWLLTEFAAIVAELTAERVETEAERL